MAENQGTVINGTKVTTTGGFLENAQFWRLREVSGTYTLPQSCAARARARDVERRRSRPATCTLWSEYTGADPESNYNGNGDTQNDFATTSPPRYYTIRLNLHY